MIDFLARANAWLNSLIWGPPMLVLLVGIGLLLTVVTGGVQSALAAFGIGNMVQANSVAHSLQSSFGFAPPVVGIVLVVISAAVILVPFMALVYLGGGAAVLVTHASAPLPLIRRLQQEFFARKAGE